MGSSLTYKHEDGLIPHCAEMLLKFPEVFVGNKARLCVCRMG